MPKSKFLYWDASVFLSYINAIPDREKTIENLILEVNSTGGLIYTSVESIVEVSNAAFEREQGRIDQSIEEKINDLWEDVSTVRTVDHVPHISEIAKRLIREVIPQGWKLTPKDAVHLATAQWLNRNVRSIDEFHTYDRGLIKFEAMIGIHICEPYVLQTRMDLM
jgi:predicted nucleic acid-binding protein